MRRLLFALFCTCLALFVSAGKAAACTAFLVSGSTPEQGLAVGKCYDWNMEQGMLFLNKRGVAKRAIPMTPQDHPAQWVSRYMSLTFNQYGREMPNGGLNEAGLVIEVLWLDESILPPPDNRPTVNELQWIQYQLDQYAKVDEVLKHLEDVRVSRVYGKVHYFVCDRGAACATIEFLNGKAVPRSGGQLPVRAITNNTYDASLAYFHKQGMVQKGAGSLPRFTRAAAHSSDKAAAPTERAFEVLGEVENDASQWQIVYDPINLRISWKSRTSQKRKFVDLSKFDGSCGTPVREIDLNIDATGDVTSRFEDYSEPKNLHLLQTSLKSLTNELPPGTVEKAAHYPAMLPCTAAAQ